jgi:uncharacterized delta-60 repeat protein
VTRLGTLIVALWLVALACVPRQALAAPGDLDPTFSEDGSVDEEIRNLGNGGGAASFEGGYLVFSAYPIELQLRRITESGRIDSAYGENGTTSLEYDFDFRDFEAADVLPDGSALIAARTNQPTNSYLFRVLPDGSIDRTFGDNGYVFLASNSGPGDPAVRGLSPIEVRQSQAGLIYLTAVEVTDTEQRFIVARFKPGGQIDPSFGSEGKVEVDLPVRQRIGNLHLLPDGRFNLVFTSVTGGGGLAAAAARYTTGGRLDTSFSDDGVVEFPFGPSSTSYTTTSKLLSDGRLVISTRKFLIRVLPDGSPDPSYGQAGIVRFGPHGFQPGIAPDGSAYVGGRQRSCIRGRYCDRNMRLTRLAPDGAVDKTFGEGGTTILDLGRHDMVNSLSVDDAGRPLVYASDEAFFMRLYRFSIARGPADRDGDGALDAEDPCPIAPGAGSKDGCPEIARQIEAFETEGSNLSLTLHSEFPRCQVRTRVRLFRLRGTARERVFDGRFGEPWRPVVVPGPLHRGRYRAIVPRVPRRPMGDCGRAEVTVRLR